MAERPLMALLLAGGESRRMGSDKAAIEIDGQTMLARTASLAAHVCDTVWVSVRSAAQADALRRQWPLIEDAPEGRGPLAGILAALRHRGDAEWLVLACDLPRLDAATLEALRVAAAERPDALAVAMRSERDGTPEPMCAIWRPGMRARIEAQLAEDRRCARRCLLDAEVPLVDAVTRGALSNMNAPEDLAAALAEDVA
ncbi:MAG: molybdenum cofactor guanylyltransferase [Pseudomonadota bacterium]